MFSQISNNTFWSSFCKVFTVSANGAVKRNRKSVARTTQQNIGFCGSNEIAPVYIIEAAGFRTRSRISSGNSNSREQCLVVFNVNPIAILMPVRDRPSGMRQNGRLHLSLSRPAIDRRRCIGRGISQSRRPFGLGSRWFQAPLDLHLQFSCICAGSEPGNQERKKDDDRRINETSGDGA